MRVVAVLLALSLSVAGGCDRRPAIESVKLAAELPFATASVEAGAPALTPESQRLGRIRGFRFGSDGRVVSAAPGAEIVLDLAAPVERTLALTVRPLGGYRSRDPRLEVEIDGASLGSLELRRGMRTYELALPARLQRPGGNRLRFVLGTSAGRAPRSARVQWEGVELLPEPAGAPALLQQGEGLMLPWLSTATFHHRVDEGAVLRLPAVEATEVRERGVLRVEIRAAGAPDGQVYEIEPAASGAAPRQWPLPGPGIVRVALTAVPTSPGASRGGLSLAGAEIIGASASPTVGEGADAETLAPAGDGPSILVYMIDTLRADHLGTYGYGRATSPRIDAFAAEAIVFERAQAQSSWTKPAVASLLTGLLPQHHGVVDRADRMDPAARSLQGILRLAGYETFAVQTNSTVGFDFEFDAGFHEFVQLGERATEEVHQLSDVVNERFFAWLDGRDSDRPFLAYLHTTDPHEPYVPREPYRSRFARADDGPPLPDDAGIEDGAGARRFLEASPEVDPQRVRDVMVDRYDAEIAFNDASFGALLDGLRERGRYQDLVVVLLSDHGEEFLDHGGFSHGATLHQEVLAVPLILRLPGGRLGGTRVTSGAGHVDLLPTLLALAGLPPPEEGAGRDLVVRLGDEPPGRARRRLVSHLALGRPDEPTESILVGADKYVRRVLAGGGERRNLYDLDADPGEREELVEVRPVLAGWLATELRRVVLSAPLARSSQARLDPELERTLRALGYIQ